jgi:beta-lactamase class A
MTTTTDLDARLRSILAAGPAVAGVAVRHIERGETVSHDGDTPFPAASVFKVPVLVEAFRQIGQGLMRLTDRWELTEADKSTGSGVLLRLTPGLAPTVHDLLTLMIIISDNTATDMLVRRLGAERITATMRALGLTNTVVARTCIELVADIVGQASPALAPHETAALIRANPVDPDARCFRGTPDNNITTANEIAALLTMIETGAGLDEIGIDEGARAAMRAILLRQQLNDRLPRFLPAGTPVAHKTGSLNGPWAVRNDAGVIDLGAGGRVVVAVFTRTRMPEGADPVESARFQTAIDEQIAAIARAAYDQYAPA